VLSTDEFAEWSKKVVLFLHNTSRCDDEKYPDLLFQRGSNGFPTVSYLAADGRLLKQVGHGVTVEQLETAYRDLEKWRELRAAADRGAKDKAKELFLMEVSNGYVSFADAETRMKGIELTKDERAQVDQKLVDLEFRDLLATTPRNQKPEGGKRFLAMLRAGRVPQSSQITSFWEYIFEHAKAANDPATFEEALGELRKRMKDDARFKRYIGTLEQQLEELKQAPKK
jgi:hypothetical protein